MMLFIDACRCDNVNAVKLYLKCNFDVNEEYDGDVALSAMISNKSCFSLNMKIISLTNDENLVKVINKYVKRGDATFENLSALFDVENHQIQVGMLNGGNSILADAVLLGNTELVKEICHHVYFDPHCPTERDIRKEIRDFVPKGRLNAFEAAIITRNLFLAEEILKSGFDVHSKCSDGMTFIEKAEHLDHSEFLKLIKKYIHIRG